MRARFRSEMASKDVDHGIAAQLGRIADGFSALVSQHVALARLELAEDARAVGISVGTIAALAPFVLVGYTLLCGALALTVAPWVGLAGGLAIVGGVNVAGGVAGILLAVRHLRSRRMLGTTLQELGQSARLLSNGAAAGPLPPGAALDRRPDVR